ncbi:MAG TPA: T9SS type A sorting domain-containing protein [Bacteroidales bacterium]
MKQNRLFFLPFLTAFLLLFIISGTNSFASNNTRKVLITGKVTNSDYGNPVANHEIYIISESVNNQNASYFKTILTDEEGFYYDTLTTSLNKGSFLVYTYDYNNKIQEKKHYFRFIELSASNIFVTNFSIYMPFQAEQLQARFKYSQRNNESRFSFRFTDLSNNENISSWHWDFGDGNESTEKNPDHIFATSGLYKVKLTVAAQIFGKQKISSISMYLYVSEQSYFHMGGHCFAEYFPIDKGKAFLYFIDEYQKFIPVDTATFDTLGYYYFYEIPEGEYCIKVQPEITSEYYGTMLPTYYGDKVFWEMAVHISHHQTNWEYDIHLAEGHDTNLGKCNISGNVAYGDTLSSSRISPAKGVDFFLLNEEGSILSSHYSDEKGNFSFEKIASGNYWLTVDVPGFERKTKFIELNDENTDVSNLEIIIENGDVNMSVENNVFSNFSTLGKIYPNPARDEVNIELSATANSSLTIEILDSQGRLLQTENMVLQEGNTTVKLSTSSLKSGNYLIMVKSEGKISGKPLIVSK